LFRILLLTLLLWPVPLYSQEPESNLGDQIPPISVQQLPSERIRLRSWIAEGRAIAALPYLNAYLKQYPDNSALLLLEGEACFALERFNQAADSFARGVEKDRAKLGELFNYGRALQNLDRHEEALVVFQAMQAREEPALKVRGLFGEGLSLQADDQQDQARQKFEEVLTLDARFDRARYRLAQIILGEDPARALQLLDRVLLFDPLHHGAAYNRALALRNLQKRDEAREAMARYQQILGGRSRIALLKERWAMQPEEGSILLELGRVHRDLAVFGEALRWFARAGAAMPGAAEPILETVRTLLAADRPGDARQLIDRLGETAVAKEAQRLVDSADKVSGQER